MFTCFVCGRKIKSTAYLVDTKEDQAPIVGPECFKKIKAAGEAGFLQSEPNPFGIRLYVITPERMEYFRLKGILK